MERETDRGKEREIEWEWSVCICVWGWVRSIHALGPCRMPAYIYYMYMYIMRAQVLPTGRNIHALDPYRMPSRVAMARGRAAAEAALALHQRDNEGVLPETVAVNL
jgi:hypothetical protein